MKILISIIVSSLLIISCNNTEEENNQNKQVSKEKSWQLQKVIDLGTVSPIGLTQYREQLWLTDGDNNKLVKINQQNQVEVVLENLEHPMHLDSDESQLYIPEYGADVITIVDERNNKSKVVFDVDNLDAPAGFSIYGNQMAIADFYNHQIHFYDGNEWSIIGSKGTAESEFHYPTDVQITVDKIYVADAYNHRVQVFSKDGDSVQVIGEQDSMNASTGIYIDSSNIWVTDFENNRVLNYDLEGKLKQIIQENIDKPTDILLVNDKLYITNYGSKQLLVYEKNK